MVLKEKLSRMNDRVIPAKMGIHSNERLLDPRFHENGNRMTSVAHSSLSGLLELVDPLFELIKIRITFFVGMSAIFGYVLAANDISAAMILPVLGIFLISCGSAALNHYQERETDALMRRTNKRPLPSGVVTPRAVLSLVLLLSIAGSALVLTAGNIATLAFSLLAYLSYNGIYTPLKKVTPFAVIPGSFVGSFPVMAGGRLQADMFSILDYFRLRFSFSSGKYRTSGC